MRKRIVSIIILLLLSCGVVSADFTPQVNIFDGEIMYDFFETMMSVTENSYRFGVTREELLEGAIKEVLKNNPDLFDEIARGAYSVLDENSRYLSLEEYSGASEKLTGQFEGIGIHVSEYNGKTIVGAPISGSPAHLAGLKVGDIIVSVDSEDIRGAVLDKTISLIRGERGTMVEIGVERNGELLTFNVERDVIKINPISYFAFEENNAGYVSISTFNSNTASYLEEALFELNKQGVDKIVLDLRYNLGGLLNEAVKVASYFLPDDTLVVTEDYKNPDNNIYFKSLPTSIKFDAVVLVNEYSASASEIVAGAIKDNEKGVLVGTTTFGKGTVQQSIRLRSGGAIWITVAKYLTPSGAYIHDVGIEPNVYLTNKKQSLDISDFEEITGKRVLKLGDSGKDVLAVKQRLDAMGYPIDSLDEVFDHRTEMMVNNFQKNNELFPYGVADITTQIKIMEQAMQTEVTVDLQLEKAKSLILEM